MQATIESQLGNATCTCEDTQEMFWLRCEDDYASRLKLATLLKEQYRFREAVDAFNEAKRIRADDPALYIGLGGAELTLRRFAAAKEAYETALFYGADAKGVAFPMGVYYYLQDEYQAASDFFTGALPCEDEMKIAILYWNALSCLRGKTQDFLIYSYHEGMQVGHHIAYEEAVRVISGKENPDAVLEKAKQNQNDLNAVITMYGLLVYLEQAHEDNHAKEIKQLILKRKSVWPCISYLATLKDLQFNN